MTGWEPETSTVNAQTVKKANPNAKIELFNLYKAVPENYAQVHALTDTLIKNANEIIAKTAGATNVTLVDAYSAFAGRQSQFVITGDVHPNARGQQALAEAAVKAIQTQVETTTPHNH